MAWNFMQGPLNVQALKAISIRKILSEHFDFLFNFIYILISCIILLFLPVIQITIQIPKISFITDNFLIIIQFIFIIYIIHDFHDVNNNSLFDKTNNNYFIYLHSILEDHFDKKPKVLSSSENIKNLILVQLESYTYEFIKKPFVSPNLKKLTEQYEFIYPIYTEKYAGHSLAGTSVLQTGLPMIYPDLKWDDITKEYNFLNGYQGLPDILYSFNYKLEYASTGYAAIMGFRNWVLSHKYTPIYQAKDDNSLFNFFTKGYLEKMDKRARESKFKNNTLTYIVNTNTHSPYKKPRWCRLPFPKIQGNEKCFYCVDKVVAKFIKKFIDLKMYEHTLLVVFPDHQPYYLTYKELYILFPGMNKSDYIKNYKSDFSYYDFAPTVLDLIGIKKYEPDFIYGRNIYDPSLSNNKICIKKSCFEKHRRPDANDLAIIYKYIHFEKLKHVKRRYEFDRKFKCEIKNNNGNKTYYYSKDPCF